MFATQTVKNLSPITHSPIHPSLKRKLAFTLAETLITLAIIGVAAAITMPVFIGKYQEKATVTKVKKAYSILSQAFNSAVAKKGTPDTWGLTFDIEGSIRLGKILTSELNLAKDCENKSCCFPQGYYKLMRGANWVDVDNYETFYKVILSDGTLVRFAAQDAECDSVKGNSIALSNTCGIIGIDVNGFKGPNTVGLDMFNFGLTKFGLIPFGTPDNTIHSFSAICSATGEGSSCAAWVLYNGNMDYLHCHEKLGWKKASSCKD